MSSAWFWAAEHLLLHGQLAIGEDSMTDMSSWLVMAGKAFEHDGQACLRVVAVTLGAFDDGVDYGGPMWHKILAPLG